MVWVVVRARRMHVFGSTAVADIIRHLKFSVLHTLQLSHYTAISACCLLMIHTKGN